MDGRPRSYHRVDVRLGRRPVWDELIRSRYEHVVEILAVAGSGVLSLAGPTASWRTHSPLC